MGSIRVSKLSNQLCECGCGGFTYLSPSTNAAKNWVKGRPRRFRAGHNGGLGPWGRDYVVNELVGCWVWQRGVNEKGYGVMVVGDQRRKKAHRHYYEQNVGPIPGGHVIHHRCGNRRCVNPEHLEAVLPGPHTSEHAKARYAA